MRLHLADTLLHRARIFGVAPQEYTWEGSDPRADLQEARRLIEDCGFDRRLQELEDAESWLA